MKWDLVRAQEHEANLRRMEAQLLEAQDGIVKRTVALMESKAQAFQKAVQVGSVERERAANVCSYVIAFIDTHFSLHNSTKNRKVGGTHAHTIACKKANSRAYVHVQLKGCALTIITLEKHTCTLDFSFVHLPKNTFWQDLSLQSAERNNEARINTEMAFGAIVRANDRREEVGQQRAGAIES
eukprot:scaffold46936_cov20-Tisochrysis_lutea.AAC.1